MQRAIAALRRYHEAKSEGSPADEVDRLRLEAESLFLVVNQYQLRALGGRSALH